MKVDVLKIENRVLNIANIPVVLIIFDVLRGFMGGIGTIETIVMMLYCLYFVLFVKKTLMANIWITIFLLYAFTLALFSTNSVRTYQNFSWVFISMMMYSIAFNHVRTLDDLKQINKSILIVIWIFVINGIVTSQLGIGTNPYGGSFVMGAFAYTTLYSGSIALLLLPLIIFDLKKNYLRIITLVVSAILYGLLFLSLRRTAIIIPVVGYLIYFVYSSYKRVIIAGLLTAAVIMIVSYPLYERILMSQINARGNVFSETYDPTEEGRFLEGRFVMDERLRDDVPFHLTLFGEEVFNEYGKYNDGYFGERQIHVDYYKIIFTLGLTGMILYLLIFWDIGFKFYRFKMALPSDTYLSELKGIFITLFLVSFMVSFMGGMLSVTFRSMIFIYLGAILGVFKGYINPESVTHKPSEALTETAMQ
jgi:hypothetical protein